MTNDLPEGHDQNQTVSEQKGILRNLLADILTVSREVRILLLGQFFMNVSTFTAFPLMAVYMAQHLKFSSAEIGTVLTIHLVAGRVLPIVTGPLADRFGFRTLMVLGLALRALGFLYFAIISGPALIALTTLAIGLGTALYESAVYGIFGRQPPQIVVRIFVLNNLLLNLGVVVGPMLGAALLFFNPVAPFYASSVFFASLALGCIRFGHFDRLYVSRSSIIDSWKAVFQDKVFLLFLFATFAWWFLFSQLFVLFPLMATKLAGSEVGASAVFVTNGIAGLLFVGLSLVIFKWVSKHGVLLGCYIALMGLYSVAGFGKGLTWLLMVIALYTLVETLILPAIESITADLAHDGKQATFFGAISLSWGLGGGLGNYVGSWLAMSDMNRIEVWGVLAGAAGLGVLLTLLFNRVSARQ
ncbi:MFS transporter [Paludibacterium yongneupense]|uniref:MFS transporter n=1 Tax=Paludibacterium yongneupense TaxID=400061 RepID=UPI000409F884|nr:MFS transporter [Paludibacterium yongneupense]